MIGGRIKSCVLVLLLLVHGSLQFTVALPRTVGQGNLYSPPQARGISKRGAESSSKPVSIDSASIDTDEAVLAPPNDTRTVITPDQAQPELSLDVANVPKRIHFDSVLLQRSLVAGASCVTTWLFIKYAGLSIIQASSFQGVLGSLLFSSPAFAVASFCGSFASMSSNLLTIWDAILMGIVHAPIFYAWEAGTKIQPGKGGRLGVIAMLTNVVFLALSDARKLGNIAVQTIQAIQPFSAIAIMMASLMLHSTRKTVSATAKTDSQKRIEKTWKVVLAGAFLSQQCLYKGPVVAVKDAVTVAGSMFAGSYMCHKSPGFVMAASILGLAASFTGPFAAPLYAGVRF